MRQFFGFGVYDEHMGGNARTFERAASINGSTSPETGYIFSIANPSHSWQRSDSSS